MQPDELMRRVAEATRKTSVDWSEGRSQAVERVVQRSQRRRRVARRVAPVAFALVAGLVIGLRHRTPGPAPALAIQGAGPIDVRPAPSIAAATVEPLDESTRYENGVLFAGRLRLQARDEVMQVKAGVVTVELHHARVLMDRADAVFIHVDEGEAVVRWPGGVATLTAGAEGWYPPATPAPAPKPTKAPRPRSTPTWKRLAEEGDFGGAYVALHQAPAELRDEPAELLLAADVARLSHHPAEAIAPLRQMLKRHEADARAPLAAFTLGRVLLDELGQPTEADDAFAQARALAPNGPLADDALAREVEARSRAGDMATARQLAETYLRKLPDGPRARAVRHYGGVD